jgi:integrase/recombinase XerD
MVLIGEWRKSLEAVGLAEKTVGLYSYSVLRFISDVARPVHDIKEGHVIEFFAKLGKQGGARMTYSKALRSFFGWAVERYYIDQNPAILFKPKQPPQKDADAFSPDEISALVLAAYARASFHSREANTGKQNPAPKRAAAILLCYGTGARIGELCALRPQDVDFENGVVHFLFTKTKKPRRVEMSSIARQALEELRPYWTDRVLGDIHQATLWKWVNQAAVDLGFPEGRRNPHMLRASFATHLLNRGVPIHVVSKLLGHSDIKVTTRYSAVVDDQRRDAVAKL